MQVFGDLKNAQAELLASDPSGIVGQFWYNTTNSDFKYYNGAIRVAANLDESQIFSNKHLLEQTAPATPAAGAQALYIDGTTLKLSLKNSAGVVKTSGEIMPASATVAALAIDGNLGSTFYKEIAVNSTFTLSNLADGAAIVIVVKNTSAGAVDITPPASVRVTGTLTLAAGKYATLTFVGINSQIFLSYIMDME